MLAEKIQDLIQYLWPIAAGQSIVDVDNENRVFSVQSDPKVDTQVVLGSHKAKVDEELVKLHIPPVCSLLQSVNWLL